MSIFHTDWSTPTFELPPVGVATGPFPRRPFLQTWWQMRGRGELMLADSGAALLPLVSEQDTLRLAGEPDLCDYHSPLGAGVHDLVADLAAEVPPGTRLEFDSLPAEATSALMVGLSGRNIEATRHEHQITAVLDLAPTEDDWLASLQKKQRHEVRRKIRRFEQAAGAPRLIRMTDPGVALRQFIGMHRKAEGAKGGFMDDTMARWFGALSTDAGAHIDLLTGEDEIPLAASVGFEDATGYYLYNSAYEPDASHLSPGIVMVTLQIKQAIHAGRSVFDFLKGDEPYKFKLGAQPRPLYAVAATIGGGP